MDDQQNQLIYAITKGNGSQFLSINPSNGEISNGVVIDREV